MFNILEILVLKSFRMEIKAVFINNYKGSNQNLFPRSHTSMFGLRTWALVSHTSMFGLRTWALASHTSMFGLRTWALVALQPVAYKTGFVEDTFRPKLDNKDITNFQVCSESQGFMFH